MDPDQKNLDLHPEGPAERVLKHYSLTRSKAVIDAQ